MTSHANVSISIDTDRRRVLVTWAESVSVEDSLRFIKLGCDIIGKGAVVVTGVAPFGRGLAMCGPGDGDAWLAELAGARGP